MVSSHSHASTLLEMAVMHAAVFRDPEAVLLCNWSSALISSEIIIIISSSRPMRRLSYIRVFFRRRDFTTSGVAAGVAAGFNAPIGGLMFALEDVSSFWTKSLTWFAFTGCVVSIIVAGLFNAAFSGFLPTATFGLLLVSVSRRVWPCIGLCYLCTTRH